MLVPVPPSVQPLAGTAPEGTAPEGTAPEGIALEGHAELAKMGEFQRRHTLGRTSTQRGKALNLAVRAALPQPGWWFSVSYIAGRVQGPLWAAGDERIAQVRRQLDKLAISGTLRRRSVRTKQGRRVEYLLYHAGGVSS